jgi:D-sedoheptulose 7-phosphate isomerase
MRNRINEIINDSIETKKHLPIDNIIKCSEKIISSIKSGGKILVCGNGGSAGDSQHMAGEFINRFLIERNPLACMSLTCDSSVLTSIGNDYSFDEVFSKQVEALGNPGDILIGISTSGNSKNIIQAVEVAKNKKLFTIGLLGIGGILKDICDLSILVNSKFTPRIQESHILIIHIISEIVEKELFKSKEH